MTIFYRQDKYDTFAARAADTLITVGLTPEQLALYLQHLLFSWMVGNGDLYAKNVSIIMWFLPGQLGGAPIPDTVVANRWGLEKSAVLACAHSMAEGIKRELPEILPMSGLPSEQQTQYTSIVESNFASMQLQ